MFTFIKQALSPVARAASKLLIAVTLTFAVPMAGAITVNTVAAEQAHAGTKKKFKFGMKVLKKGMRGVEKFGGKMARKKGVVGKIGKGLRKGAHNGRKGITKVQRGMKKFDNVKRGIIRKTKVGRTLDNGIRKANKFRTKVLDRATENCRGKYCKTLRNGADLFVPGG